MENRTLLSPFYLDDALPELEPLAKPHWFMNGPLPPTSGNQSRMNAVHSRVADFVSRAVSENRRPISIAGDCCAAMGVLAGLQRAGIDPHLIWFDAHGDFNTGETSPSGFVGGMPLAMIVGRGEQTMVRSLGLRTLPEERVILCDARDLDPGEREAVAASGVTHISKPEALLDHSLPEGPLYVHFDTDVVCSDESPAHNYPAPGGPSSAILRAVFAKLAESGRVIAVSLAAWNPALDKDGRSETISMSLLQTLTGAV